MAGEDSTDVFVNGVFETTLNAGESIVVELPSAPGLEITSSAPVQVDVSYIEKVFAATATVTGILFTQ